MSSPQHAGRSQRTAMTIPQFEPLPPTSVINRIINKVLAPLFYLLFTIITAVIVVPVYTVIENFKHGRNSKGGQRIHTNQDPSKPQAGPSQAKDFLSNYSSSYVSADGEVKEKANATSSSPKSRHGHRHHRTPREKEEDHEKATS